MICAYTYSTIGIINPIKKLERLMRSAGEGDLTVKIDIQSKDEIEELEMNKRFKKGFNL